MNSKERKERDEFILKSLPAYARVRFKEDDVKYKIKKGDTAIKVRDNTKRMKIAIKGKAYWLWPYSLLTCDAIEVIDKIQKSNE